MRRGQRGMAALEVMIATVLLGLGIVPILSMVVGTSREAGFSEAHILVQARAATLLDCQEALGWETIDGLGDDVVELSLPSHTPARPALPQMAGAARYQEKLTFKKLGEDLGILAVEIQWVLGTDQGRAKAHEFREFRIISRPDGSWLHSVPLPVKPTPEPAV